MTGVRIISFGLLACFIGFGLFGSGVQQAHAQEAVTYEDIRKQGIIFAGVCPGPTTPCDCRDQGRCQLEDILQVAVNIGTFVLAISGSVLILLFVYGGFIWLTSGGNPDRVNNGKKVLTGAVIGILIVFGAYTGITVLLSVLKTGEIPETGETLEEVIGTVKGTCSKDNSIICRTDKDCSKEKTGKKEDAGTCTGFRASDIIETVK